MVKPVCELALQLCPPPRGTFRAAGANGLRLGSGLVVEAAKREVEDEASVRRLVQRILSAAGYHVLEAGDGRQALEIAEHFEDPICLLVTDVVMPGISGGDLARRLRENRPDLDALFLSGYPEETGEVDAGLLNPGRFLQKPFTDEELLEKIRTILDQGL